MKIIRLDLSLPHKLLDQYSIHKSNDRNKVYTFSNHTSGSYNSIVPTTAKLHTLHIERHTAHRTTHCT